LNLAYHKMEEMKLEAGKISNIELQKTISRVLYYLCVVSRDRGTPLGGNFPLYLIFHNKTAFSTGIPNDQCFLLVTLGYSSIYRTNDPYFISHTFV